MTNSSSCEGKTCFFTILSLLQPNTQHLLEGTTSTKYEIKNQDTLLVLNKLNKSNQKFIRQLKIFDFSNFLRLYYLIRSGIKQKEITCSMKFDTSAAIASLLSYTNRHQNYKYELTRFGRRDRTAFTRFLWTGFQ